VITIKKVEDILKEIRPDIDVNSKSLVDDEALDSFDIVTLVSELIQEYGVEINVEDIIPDNFNSVEAIYALIERLK
jgi:acyl carrier protein